MRSFLASLVLAGAAAPLGGCCAIARTMCEFKAQETPQKVSRDTPDGAVDFVIEAFRRRAPGEIYESLHPRFLETNGGFSLADFSTAFAYYESDFRADAERLAAARRDPVRMKDGLAWIFLQDGDASLWLVLKNRPGSRVLLDDDVVDEIRGALPDLSEVVAVEGDGLVLRQALPLQGQGDFVDPSRVRRVELFQDWLLYEVAEPKNIRFVDRIVEEMKGSPPMSPKKAVSKKAVAKKAPAVRKGSQKRGAGPTVAARRTYAFGDGKADGRGDMKEILGGKGAGLAEMSRLGLPVPPGFTIATTVCKSYWDAGGKLPADLWPEVERRLAMVERHLGRTFGAGPRPLLVSVRSGAASSMPGMMDTVLNVGLNSDTREALAKETGNRRFALDSHRRLIHMFARVVEEMEVREFDQVLDTMKRRRGATSDADLTEQDLEEIVAIFGEIFQARAGRPFPDDPREQLRRCVMAVFGSWNGERAKKYRDIHRITGLLGTAVNVQAMVFGNMGDGSATGVCFTRDPATGENVFYGEFLPNAQGEDVVAGIRTPLPIAQLKKLMPKPYGELVRVKDLLERHFGDVQDMEFTIQQGKLWMLQTRTGKRTAEAAVRIASEMVDEGRITRAQGLLRVDPSVVDRLLHPAFDRKARREVLAKGLPASPGAASGQIVFSAEDAEAWKKAGRKVILVRDETSPEDIGGMHAAEGILTSRGGMTSHAAVVARGMGKCCVVGCGAVTMEHGKKTMSVAGRTLVEGDWLSIDGSSGEVMAGQVATTQAKLSKHFRRIMEWADMERTVGVRANAETPLDARVAREFGAEGIGLCRTEHMFFDEDRIVAVREMILAEDKEGREKALGKLLPYQQRDFEAIFGSMDGLPVTVRLLDPPLHEFVPNTDKAQAEVAASLGIPVDRVRRRVQQLHELNPMMGHRGCRLGISHPEIYEMQVRAIARAVVALRRRRKDPRPEIMIPLVGHVNELRPLAEMTRRVMDEVLGAAKLAVPYTVGTMIEVPRAALTADLIATEAQFFSFGTNDLTQMTFGFSRDDVNGFLPAYIEQKVLPEDPFQSLDIEGVGQLIKMAIERGRRVRKNLKVGICGEHGGDPRSVAFCCEVGMDYVSCSPYRVPIARIAAAQAALRARGMK